MCALRAIPMKCLDSRICIHRSKPVNQELSFFLYVSAGVGKTCLMKPGSGFDMEGIWLPLDMVSP